MGGQEQQPRRTLMDVSDVRPIFDDDFANGVSLDVSSKRELNDLRQLDGAAACLRLEFA
jgi:hypothetical protein